VATATHHTTMGKALGRVKTRRATASEQTLIGGSGGAASHREEGPEGGLPRSSRDVMNLEDFRVRRPAVLACSRRVGQRQEGSGTSKDPRIGGRRKALKVAIPGATQLEMAGRLEGEQGVKRGLNSEDATCRWMGPSALRPFELAIAVGNETP
jgi:hypothetical protein